MHLFVVVTTCLHVFVRACTYLCVRARVYIWHSGPQRLGSNKQDKTASEQKKEREREETDLLEQTRSEVVLQATRRPAIFSFHTFRPIFLKPEEFVHLIEISVNGVSCFFHRCAHRSSRRIIFFSCLKILSLPVHIEQQWEREPK